MRIVAVCAESQGGQQAAAGRGFRMHLRIRPYFALTMSPFLRRQSNFGLVPSAPRARNRHSTRFCDKTPVGSGGFADRSAPLGNPPLQHAGARRRGAAAPATDRLARVRRHAAGRMYPTAARLPPAMSQARCQERDGQPDHSPGPPRGRSQHVLDPLLTGNRAGLLGRPRERVALARIAGRQPAPEPLRALRRAAVREALGRHAAARQLRCMTIVANGPSRAQGLPRHRPVRAPRARPGNRPLLDASCPQTPA